MTSKVLRQIGTALAVVLLLAVSLTLVSYARWLRQIADGNRALTAGDMPAARQAYDAATRRLDQFDFLRQINIVAPVGGPGYRQLVFNRARVLYAARQDDDLTHMLENEAARTPALAEDSE